MRVKLGLKLELFGGGWLSKMGLCQFLWVFVYPHALFPRWIPTGQPAWRVFEVEGPDQGKARLPPRDGRNLGQTSSTNARICPWKKCIPMLIHHLPSHHKSKNKTGTMSRPLKPPEGEKISKRTGVLRLGSVTLRKNLARATKTRPGSRAEAGMGHWNVWNSKIEIGSCWDLLMIKKLLGLSQVVIFGFDFSLSGCVVYIYIFRCLNIVPSISMGRWVDL